MNGVSVIICCYNSALRLPLALEYLSKQQAKAGLNWEIIVVNNSSKDDTPRIAKQLQISWFGAMPFSIIDEPNPGLSYARQAGVSVAMYDIIVFCDDDNLLERNYIQYAFDLVKRTKSSGYGIWGGKSAAYFDSDTKVPEWFEREKSNYVVGEQGAITGDICKRGYVWGAGMIILKQLYFQIINEEYPSLLSDRTGSNLTSGGDSEISLRALIAGYKLYYDEKLELKHYITKERLTEAYNNGLVAGFRTSNTILNKYRIFIHYISTRNILQRLYYAIVYNAKYFFSIFNIRALTEHDKTVLHALFQNRFNDADFNLMRRLVKKNDLNTRLS